MLNFLSASENSTFSALLDWVLENITILSVIAAVGIVICGVIYICFFKKINALIKK